MSRSKHPAKYWGCQGLSDSSDVVNASDATVMFVAIAKRIHGREGFGYDRASFRALLLPWVVTCRKHGDVHVTVIDHLLLKKGCPKCEQGEKPKDDEPKDDEPKGKKQK